jgi:tetratricopeptide (TPR) repeat protein
MNALARVSRLASVAAAATMLTQVCLAQTLGGPMVGQDEQAMQTWSRAMEAINKDDFEQANKLLAAVAEKNLSPLRLALMADRTGTFSLTQALEDNKLGDAAKGLMQQIEQGRQQRTRAEDGWHYAAIGQFGYAKSNFESLIKSDPDPVAVLELAGYNPYRETILLQLMDREDIGPAVKDMLKILKEGRFRLRTDPPQIIANIRKLGGTARERVNAVVQLKASGEWSVPLLLDVLMDPAQEPLHKHVLDTLGEIGKPAVTPLAVSLAMDNNPIKVFVIRALGKIGYPHAVPYLKQLLENKETPDQVRDEAAKAVQQIEQTSGKKSPGSAAEGFLALGDAYYYDHGSLMAEPDAPVVNIWFWRDGRLTSTQVPPRIFNDLMAMRSAEAALQLNSDLTEAVALWLAANFRREAHLGVADVASEAVDPATAQDPTRPDGYPRAIYFARAAGARYNHLVLSRGLKDAEPGVILGALAALRDTAGASNLIGAEDYKQPLVQALTFPNLIVRIKAALVLGNALPTKEFAGAGNVVPALAEALAQTGQKHAVVVEPDEANRNRVVGILREAGFVVVAGESFYSTLQDARKNVPSLDLVLIPSNLKEPAFVAALNELRKDYLFASAATVLLISPADDEVVRPLLHLDSRIGGVPADAPAAGLLAEYDRVRRQIGALPLDRATALSLATQAAEALRMIAVTNNKVYNFRQAQVALINSLKHPEEALRVIGADVLAESEAPEAQQAVAQLALDETQSKPVRLRVFAALANSAKAHGNLLNDEWRDQVAAAATQAKDLEIRTAASQALGALNLPSNQASKIIRAQAMK